MSKSEGEHDKTKQIITPKKGLQILLKSSNLFIDIPIVAEVFRSTAGSLLALQAQRTLSCIARFLSMVFLV
jgi:hypothetical protein